MGLLDVLTQALGSNNDHATVFNQAAQEAPTDVLGKGLAAAFRSDQTPDIGSMVGQMFGQSNGSQQAGMLNELIKSLGPTVAATLGGGILGKYLNSGQGQLTPDQASQLSPQEVQDVVNHAHEVNPGVADQLGDFYANHKTLIHTIGGLAASIALMKMKDHMTGR